MTWPPRALWCWMARRRRPWSCSSNRNVNGIPPSPRGLGGLLRVPGREPRPQFVEIDPLRLGANLFVQTVAVLDVGVHVSPVGVIELDRLLDVDEPNGFVSQA